MQITGDTNATFKDLTRIVEAEIMAADVPLYPQICSTIESADEAYLKIPIQSKVGFPVAFDGEREPTSTEVAVNQTYNKGTYALTLQYDSDQMRESKAYTFEEKTQEGAMSAVIFPSYNLTTNVIVANGLAFDGVAFYSATGHYWPGGPKTSKYLINNVVTATGVDVVSLTKDLNTAVTRMRTYVDNQLRILNPRLRYGADQLVIHCPVALELAFNQVIFNSMNPISAPVTTSGTAAVSASGLKDIGGLKGVATIVSDGYLDTVSATTWYLHYVGAPQRPFVYSESYGVTAKALGFDSEFEQRTNNVAINVKQRFLEGYYRFDRSVKIA
jgi:hypothetical protein